MADDGAGYQVDTGKIHAAGQAAIRVGEAVAALADDVDPGCAMPAVPAGLGVGATLLAIDPFWQQHFRSVGADVQRTGNNLCQVSGNYSHAEAVNSSAFDRIMS